MLEKLTNIFYYFPYLSIAIITIGIIALLGKKTVMQKIGLVYVVCLLLFEVYGEFYPKLTNKPNLIVLSLSAYIHFAFLSYLYLRQFYSISLFTSIIVILVGLLPVLSNLETFQELSSFNSYDRALFSFIIMLLTLAFMYFIVAKKIPQNKRAIFFNYFVLVFFSIDTFLALPANYLVNASPEIVVLFWLIRALALQAYYIVLIRYLWKWDKRN